MTEKEVLEVKISSDMDTFQQQNEGGNTGTEQTRNLLELSDVTQSNLIECEPEQEPKLQEPEKQESNGSGTANKTENHETGTEESLNMTEQNAEQANSGEVDSNDNEHNNEDNNDKNEEDDNNKVYAFSDDEIQVNSSDGNVSDSESDSSGSSSDSSSDSESDSDDCDSGDEDEIKQSDNEEEKITGPIVSKNEIVNEEAPSLPEGYELGDKPIEPLGEITGFVDNNIIIKGHISAEFRVLKENSILCLKDQALGPLFEIFGNLKSPIYRIKFNNSPADSEKYESLKKFKGEQVYYVVPDSEFVFTDSIKVLKGSDASNFNDEEIPEDEQEFSDDEKEMAAKQRKKKNKSKSDKSKDDNVKSGKRVGNNAQQNPKRKKIDTSPLYPQQFMSYNPPQSQQGQPQTQQFHQFSQQLPYPSQHQAMYNQYNNHQTQSQFQTYPNQFNNQVYNTPQFQPYNQAANQFPHPYNQHNQFNQGFNQFPPQQNQFNQPVPSQAPIQNLNGALANASPEQLRLLEQLLQQQLNNK